jgi:hypothetical protein
MEKFHTVVGRKVSHFRLSTNRRAEIITSRPPCLVQRMRNGGPCNSSPHFSGRAMASAGHGLMRRSPLIGHTSLSCCVWRHKHHPRRFICGQCASGVDALCAMHCAMLHHHCGGRLWDAIAVGMGNTLGPGETGRRCMVISRGASTHRSAMWQEERTTTWCVGVCDKKISRKFFCSPVAWPFPASLSAVCLAILLLHFSAVRLATDCFFLEILL